jgi:hypothetical protein
MKKSFLVMIYKNMSKTKQYARKQMYEKCRIISESPNIIPTIDFLLFYDIIKITK